MMKVMLYRAGKCALNGHHQSSSLDVDSAGDRNRRKDLAADTGSESKFEDVVVEV
jgi:hypothetical protein